MKNIWMWSDLHLGHENMYKFLNEDGTKLRNWETMEEAEEYMVQEYNKLVKPQDTVYFLGDISSKNTVADKFFKNIVKSRRVLICGNHDNRLGAKFWLKHFDDLRGCYNLSQSEDRTNYLLTHIPVHSDSKGKFKRCIHGHIHSQQVRKKFPIVDEYGYPSTASELDPWYKNVSVEVIGYRPLNFDEIVEETNELIENGEIIIPKKKERMYFDKI